MAICNRDLDVSQQKTSLRGSAGAVVTGSTLAMVIIDSPCAVSAAKVALFGVSNTPTVLLSVQRFIVGSGVTSYLGGFTTLNGQAAGTSGVQSIVTAAAGSTALLLQAGDVVMATVAGTNAAVTSLAVDLVVQYTQDIKSYFGV